MKHEKAFLQIGLRPEDRDATRFLWIKNPPNLSTDGNMEILRFTRILFGLAPSPSLLGTCIKIHLNNYPGTVPQIIQCNIFVDNVVCGVESLEDAVSFYTTAKGIFRDASMNLREWHTNDAGFRNAIPISDRSSGHNVKVLGLYWDSVSDTISVRLNIPLCDNITRRIALQQLASIFDPLGLLSPILVKGKIVLQGIWKTSQDWESRSPQRLSQHGAGSSKNSLEYPVIASHVWLSSTSQMQ